jgi:membrane protein DedA with SNARE-associated domain
VNNRTGWAARAVRSYAAKQTIAVDIFKGWAAAVKRGAMKNSRGRALRLHPFRVTQVGQPAPIARMHLTPPVGVLKLRFCSFTMAAAIGIILWNTPFLRLGYVLHRSRRGPVQIGFWVSTILIAVEALILLALRSRRKNAQAAEARPWQRSRDGAYLMRVDDP